MNIASVIPVVSLPEYVSNEFDYTIPDKLHQTYLPPFGSAVLVDLRGKNEVAILIKTKKRSQIPTTKLKALKKILTQTPIIGDDYIPLYNAFARFYHIGVAHALKVGLPKIPRHTQTHTSLYTSKVRHTTSAKIKPLFLRYEDTHRIYLVYKSHILRAQENQRPLLIICPTKDEAEYLWEFSSDICKDTKYADSSISSREFFRLYTRFLGGKIPVMIGTRRLLFWHSIIPYTLILHNAQDNSYKQHDQTPRYDARDVFLMMSQILQNCQLIASGTSIPLVFYGEIKTKRLQYKQILRAYRPKICVITPEENTIKAQARGRTYVCKTSVPYSLCTREAGKYDTVIVKNFDLLTNINFFNAWERCYQNIESLKILLKPHGTLVMPTKNPEHPLLDTTNFLEKELAIRERLNLPPTKKLIKLTFPQTLPGANFLDKLKNAPFQDILPYRLVIGPKEKMYIVLIPLVQKAQEKALFGLLRKSQGVDYKIDINPISLL